MAHAFDGTGFGHLLVDAEHLLTRARNHERRLTGLVASLDGDADRVASVRQLCVDAREQRLMLETMLARLVGGRAETSEPRPPRVLIVDDCYDNRELAAMVLEAAGFDVITAADGVEGMIVAHYALPPVILLDLSMPGLDGIGAARLLKASAVTRDLTLIAYTAARGVADAGGTRFFEGVLEKPASPEAIVASVRRFLPAAVDPAV